MLTTLFRFYDRSLDAFNRSTDSLSRSFAGWFHCLVACHERLSEGFIRWPIRS
jgi:hypothetical protein